MSEIVEKYRQEWEAAKAKLDRDVAHTAATKGRLPDNYWQAEHRARERYRVAIVVSQELEVF